LNAPVNRFVANRFERSNAIHLASVLVVRSAVAGVELLSLDDRIRKAARRLGLRLRPE
jgi:hypothetical protein